MSPGTTPISSSRSGERLFALLCVLIGGMGQGVVAPQLPRLLGSAGSLALESGISATILYFGIFLATFFYGNWADRGKVHLLLGFGLVGYAGTLLAMSASPGLTTFYLLRFIEGLTLSAVFVSADYLLGKLSAADERGRWLSYFGVAISAGLLLGPLLVLGMPASFGDPMQGVALAALACAVGTGAWIRVPRETSNTDERSGRSPSKSDARGAFGAGGVYGAMEASLVAVLPVIALRYFKLKPELCLIAVIVAAAVASVPWGVLSDRAGPRRIVLLLLGLLTFGAIALRIWSASSPAGAVLGYVSCAFFGAIAGGLYPVAFSWALESYPVSAYGEASGAFTRAYGLGSLLGPAVAGAWVEATGFGGLLGFLAIAGALGIGLAGAFGGFRGPTGPDSIGRE